MAYNTKTMSRVAILAVGLVACVVAGGLLAWHLATPVLSVTPQPFESTTAPRPSGRCGCTDADCPVCRGPQRWRNQCQAECEGVYDARRCPDNTKTQCTDDSDCCPCKDGRPNLCFDDPPGHVENRGCVIVNAGRDERLGRKCRKGEDGWLPW